MANVFNFILCFLFLNTKVFCGEIETKLYTWQIGLFQQKIKNVICFDNINNWVHARKRNFITFKRFN
jgi:hypothetical protein